MRGVGNDHDAGTGGGLLKKGMTARSY